MRGRILGFDATTASGAIAGDNGERFSFVSAQWRSGASITPGATVDFAALAGVATEIYPVGGGAMSAPDLSALTKSPTAQKLCALATSTLAFPLAALLLIATLFPVLEFSLPGLMAMTASSRGVTLWSTGGLSKQVAGNPLLGGDAADLKQQLAKTDQDEAELRQELAERSIPVPTAAQIATAKSGTISLYTGESTLPSRFKEFAEQRAKLQQQVSDANWLSLLTTLLIVRFLVPVGAIALLWLSVTGGVLRTPSIATGAVAIATALMFYLVPGALLGHPDEGSLGGMISNQIASMISVGVGTYLIGLIGIGLVLAGTGLIKNPLAAEP